MKYEIYDVTEHVQGMYSKWEMGQTHQIFDTTCTDVLVMYSYIDK